MNWNGLWFGNYNSNWFGLITQPTPVPVPVVDVRRSHGGIPFAPPLPAFDIAADDEEIANILCLWLNLK